MMYGSNITIIDSTPDNYIPAICNIDYHIQK